MNSTRNLIFATAFVVNAAVIAAISVAITHRHDLQTANTIQLGTIVVTPADAETGTINLGTIVVTPSEGDWRYAAAHGVHHPVASIELGAITVTPTAAQLTDVAKVKTANSSVSAEDADTVEDAATVSLVEALNSFSPGQYLDTDAALRVLNTLVFEGQGG